MPSGIFCILILLFSSFISGVSGFGFSMVALTLLSLLYDIKKAVVFLAIHTLTCNIFQLIKLKEHISPKETLPLLIGAIAGVPAGVYFLKNMDPWWIKKLLGIIIITFVIQQILHPQKEKSDIASKDKPNRREDTDNPRKGVKEQKKEALTGLLVGTASGVLMGGFLSGGPPIVIYSLKKGTNNKYIIKATLQSFFLFSSAYAIMLYYASDLLSTPMLFSSMFYLPATIIGTGIGIMVFEAISFPVFRKILLIFITLLGFSLLFK